MVRIELILRGSDRLRAMGDEMFKGVVNLFMILFALSECSSKVNVRAQSINLDAYEIRIPGGTYTFSEFQKIHDASHLISRERGLLGVRLILSEGVQVVQVRLGVAGVETAIQISPYTSIVGEGEGLNRPSFWLQYYDANSFAQKESRGIVRCTQNKKFGSFEFIHLDFFVKRESMSGGVLPQGAVIDCRSPGELRVSDVHMNIYDHDGTVGILTCAESLILSGIAMFVKGIRGPSMGIVVEAPCVSSVPGLSQLGITGTEVSENEIQFDGFSGNRGFMGIEISERDVKSFSWNRVRYLGGSGIAMAFSHLVVQKFNQNAVVMRSILFDFIGMSMSGLHIVSEFSGNEVSGLRGGGGSGPGIPIQAEDTFGVDVDDLVPSSFPVGSVFTICGRASAYEQRVVDPGHFFTASTPLTGCVN